MFSGRVFQTQGPATLKARLLTVESLTDDLLHKVMLPNLISY